MDTISCNKTATVPKLPQTNKRTQSQSCILEGLERHEQKETDTPTRSKKQATSNKKQRRVVVVTCAIKWVLNQEGLLFFWTIPTKHVRDVCDVLILARV